MPDLVLQNSDTVENGLGKTLLERFFPSDTEAEELYTSELNQGVAFSPLSVMYYIDKDERNANEESNADLKGALQEQGQIISLLQEESVEEPRFKEIVSTIESPAGWKGIAYMLKDMKFGEKTLMYLNRRLGKHTEEFRSLEETVKLLKANLKQQSANGA